MQVLFIIIALSMLILAFWILNESKKNSLNEKMLKHFKVAFPNSSTVSALPKNASTHNLQELKVRASIYFGFEIQKLHLILIPISFLLLSFFGWAAYGFIGAVLIIVISVFFFGFLLPYTRLQKRRAHTISQIPIFVDQVSRTLTTGRSLENAIRFASDESTVPLRIILDRVIRSADLGADLIESMTEAGRLHQLRELNLIALAMRISNNYGSSPQGMLDSVVKMIRQQEQARRELAAMTGETRISAWVLGLTPIAIAAYIMVMNPNYLNMLLHDSAGQMMVIVAITLQCLGAFILWRMLRSV